MICQIRLIVLIPRKLWNGQRDWKVWLRKESSVHTLGPSLATPPEETLGTSWHYQIGIIPWQGFCHKPYEVTSEPQIKTQPLVHICVSFNRSHTQARTRAPSVLNLSWRTPGEPPRWKVVAELWKTPPGFLTSGGEEFNTGPVMRLDHSERLCNKGLVKYKRGRKSFWHRRQKRVGRVPLC